MMVRVREDGCNEAEAAAAGEYGTAFHVVNMNLLDMQPDISA